MRGPPRCADDGVGKALSPHAGRGDACQAMRSGFLKPPDARFARPAQQEVGQRPHEGVEAVGGGAGRQAVGAEIADFVFFRINCVKSVS